MHNLGIGGIDFEEKHTLNEHRPNGYKIPEVSFDEDTATFQNEQSSIINAETTTHGMFVFRKNCVFTCAYFLTQSHFT